jgi:hypothetical protein
MLRLAGILDEYQQTTIVSQVDPNL